MKYALFLCIPETRINQEIAVGLAGELQRHDDWHVFTQPRYVAAAEIKRVVRNTKPDAVIARALTPDLVTCIGDPSIPTVAVIDAPRMEEDCSLVSTKGEAIGEMAAEYFLSQTFEHFGMVHFQHPSRGDGRLETFAEMIRQSRMELDEFTIPREGIQALTELTLAPYDTSPALVQWLQGLAKPCAIFAHSDAIGAYIITACMKSGIRVPEEVSVLGVDDDLLHCHTVMPNLASIHVPNRRIGIEAARMVLDWKTGKRAVNVAPTMVVERASCRPPLQNDPLVNDAIDYLRRNVAKGVRVRDLQQLTGLSSYQLVHRFHLATGRTPMEMILMARIAIAKRLLVDTTELVGEIALKSGFGSKNRFHVAFRDHVEISPLDYRDQFTSK